MADLSLFLFHRDSVVVEENCDVAAKGNVGCPTRLGDEKSYGPPFNANGGGHYAIERSPEFIKVWFWPRGDKSIPAEVKKGAEVVNTDSWVRRRYLILNVGSVVTIIQCREKQQRSSRRTIALSTRSSAPRTLLST